MKGMRDRHIRFQKIDERLIEESSPNHDFPVSAPGCEHIQIIPVVAPFNEKICDIAVFRNRTCWRNMVRRNVIADYEQRVGAVLSQLTAFRHGSKRRTTKRGRLRVPWKAG